MSNVEPKTRLDRLVQVRERMEDSALQNLARAQSSLGRATARLAGLRQAAQADGRGRGLVELWVAEESAHVRTLQQVRTAERDLSTALRGEQVARVGFTAAQREAEVARRVQEKKRRELRAQRDRRDQRALDELATLGFNARAR
jgi:flagellar export protein FliJ